MSRWVEWWDERRVRRLAILCTVVGGVLNAAVFFGGAAAFVSVGALMLTFGILAILAPVAIVMIYILLIGALLWPLSLLALIGGVFAFVRLRDSGGRGFAVWSIVLSGIHLLASGLALSVIL